MTVNGKITIARGQTQYVFEAEGAGANFVLAQLEEVERWVFDSPNRLSALDEAEKFRAAQPGDTVQMRIR